MHYWYQIYSFESITYYYWRQVSIPDSSEGLQTDNWVVLKPPDSILISYTWLEMSEVELFAWSFNGINFSFCFQRVNGRIRNSAILAARNPCWTTASTSSNSDQKVSKQRWNCYVVPYLHVGNHLPPQHRPSHLVRHRRETVRNTKSLIRQVTFTIDGVV